MAVDTAPAQMVRVGHLDDLASAKVKLVSGGRHGIAVFLSDGQPYAVDNRCPHMGFPLHKGSICDGILTCHWHHARFDLASGGTFDPWADDVRSYDTHVDDGVVWVDTEPRPVNLVARGKARLQDGLEQNLNLVMVKAVLGLLEAGVAPMQISEVGARFGATYRDAGWRSGLTILSAMQNILPQLNPGDQALALYHGMVHIARECEDEPPRFQLDALPDTDATTRQITAWYRQFIEVRDRDGAERALLTAIDKGASSAEIAHMLFAGATDHVYLDGGHTLDFVNKACELMDQIGWTQENATQILPSLVGVQARSMRGEESNSWRHPIDLISMMSPLYDRLPELVEKAGTATTPLKNLDDLAKVMLGDEPEPIFASIIDALENGASLTQLSQALTYAAAVRVAHFHTSNEFADWFTVLHTFTYCNAVHQGLKRAPSVELARGILHGAGSIYLDRFLNMPSARLPEKRNADAEPEDATELLERLADLLDREQRVNESALTVHRYLSLGHDRAALKAMLGHLLLREDAEFHSYQMLEAGIALHDELVDDRPEAASRALVAAVRYLAAHSPTPRAMLQTAKTAIRLQRGDAVYTGAEGDEDDDE